jgi:hypothetical protein
MFIINAENTKKRKIMEKVTLTLETQKDVERAMYWLTDSCNQIRVQDSETGEIMKDFYTSGEWFQPSREIYESLLLIRKELGEE